MHSHSQQQQQRGGREDDAFVRVATAHKRACEMYR